MTDKERIARRKYRFFSLWAIFSVVTTTVYALMTNDTLILTIVAGLFFSLVMIPPALLFAVERHYQWHVVEPKMIIMRDGNDESI